MPEIELSVMIHTRQTVDVLERLLKDFETQSGVHVKLTPLHWETAHNELNRTALYHHGPDVSEIGSTWASDLIAMNALRPFSKIEIAQIGKAEEFAAESWKTGHLLEDDMQWAIPWLAETFVIHYRRDLLQQAGIDETSAFASHDNLAATVDQLKKSITELPIEFPFQQDVFGSLHVLSSWVWTAGGDFCTADGKQVLFNQPAAQKAILNYFNLTRGLPAWTRRKLREREGSLFAQGEAAIGFGTLMLYQNRENAPARVKENWRVASLPKEHFMGGSNLVVWKHTRNERAALDLVRFLTSTPIQTRAALPLGTLPPRLAALADPQIAGDPILSVFAESIRTGRSYYGVTLWGLIEDRLVVALQQMGNKVISDEEIDLEPYIRHQTDMLARRLNITLSQ
jgi:ABC-type glycerol-3-phosphate transport system substrate-binding protein